MNSFKNALMAGMLAISVSPALADHDREDNRDDNDNWKNKRNINVRVNDNRFENSNRYHNKHYRRYQAANNDWNDRDRDWDGQRTLYRNNWNRVSRERQQQLDTQMRAQWLAYHHNNYNGDYTWNQYSDPRFLDYVHRSNPSLLNSLRNYIGF